MILNGEGKVYVEKPDVVDVFHHASYFLPPCQWEDVSGFTADEIASYQNPIKSAVAD